MVSVGALQWRLMNTAPMASYVTGFDPIYRWSIRSRMSFSLSSTRSFFLDATEPIKDFVGIPDRHADPRSQARGQQMCVLR